LEYDESWRIERGVELSLRIFCLLKRSKVCDDGVEGDHGYFASQLQHWIYPVKRGSETKPWLGVAAFYWYLGQAN